MDVLLILLYEKHRIKQADRLLSNKHILEEALSIYKVIYKQFASASSRPIILIDWSDLGTHKGFFLLRASVAFKGRGARFIKKFMVPAQKKNGVHIKHF
jgi:hypothetical protein